MIKEIATQDYMEQELKKFNVTDAMISQLKEEYLPLVISDHEDKEGYKIVSAARKVVKSYRCDVEKRRKELVADALKFQRAINDEAKRVTEQLEPLEEYLEKQENEFILENERIKKEIENQKNLIIQNRQVQLINMGFSFVPPNWKASYFNDTPRFSEWYASEELIRNSPDEEFNSFVEQVDKEYSTYEAYKCELEQAKKEQEALDKFNREEKQRIEREEFEKQKRILDEQRLAMEEKAKELAQQQAKINEDKRQQDELEKMRKDLENVKAKACETTVIPSPVLMTVIEKLTGEINKKPELTCIENKDFKEPKKLLHVFEKYRLLLEYVRSLASGKVPFNGLIDGSRYALDQIGEDYEARN